MRGLGWETSLGNSGVCWGAAMEEREVSGREGILLRVSLGPLFRFSSKYTRKILLLIMLALVLCFFKVDSSWRRSCTASFAGI